jgi:hypothetical protein
MAVRLRKAEAEDQEALAYVNSVPETIKKDLKDWLKAHDDSAVKKWELSESVSTLVGLGFGFLNLWLAYKAGVTPKAILAVGVLYGVYVGRHAWKSRPDVARDNKVNMWWTVPIELLELAILAAGGLFSNIGI